MSLRDRLDAPEATSWRPDDGDDADICGPVTDVTTNISDYGSYPVYVVDDEVSGEPKAIHAFHTVLRNALEGRGVVVGDEIAVRFLGKTASKKGGNSFWNYKVACAPGPNHGAGNATEPAKPTAWDNDTDDGDPF